jgi:hypothetical protein
MRERLSSGPDDDLLNTWNRIPIQRRVTVDESRTYSVPDPLQLNSWALSGE